MKPIAYFSMILLGVSTLTSCFAPKTLVDDDVYMVKNSALPIGESLTDETSYSSYRFRRDNNFYGANVYQGDLASYSFYSMDNRFYNAFFGYRNFNFISRYTPFGIPYFSYDYGYSYAFLGNSYLGYYGALWYLNCTPGNNYDNGFYASTGYTSTPEFKNAFSGPRNNISGFSNQYGRMNPSTLKSSSFNSGNSNKPGIITSHSGRVNYPLGSQVDYSDRTLSRNNGVTIRTSYKSTERPNSGQVYSGQPSQVRVSHSTQDVNNRNQNNSHNSGNNNSAPRSNGNAEQSVRGVNNNHVNTGRRN